MPRSGCSLVSANKPKAKQDLGILYSTLTASRQRAG